MRKYFFEVKTADENDAGTNANIRVRIFGANGTTSSVLLDISGYDDFERNDRDVYLVSAEDVGIPQAIEVAHTDGGSAWKLSWIKVTLEQDGASPGGTWGAQYKDWLKGQTVKLTLAPANGPCNWMSQLSDSTYIHDLNIPGTHDSATFKPAHAYDQCQTLSIRQQLNLGIRFLDLRLRCLINTAATPSTPAAQRENFTIHHGSNWQNLYFDKESWINDPNMSNFPLQDCLEFLQAFPKEAIILSIKQEHYGNDDEKARFEQAFKDLVARHDPEGKIFYTDTQVPTLEKIRGSIVIVNRSKALGTSYGISWDWPDADRGIKKINGLYIEDNYMDTTSAAKEANIHKNLQQANAKKTGETTWFGTFVSCAPGNASPYEWAKSMNPFVSSYIDRVGTSAFYGTVIMDYPPKLLVDKLIERYMISF